MKKIEGLTLRETQCAQRGFVLGIYLGVPIGMVVTIAFIFGAS